MIGRIVRVGVDLALADQRETMRLDQGDDVLFAQVALAAVGIGSGCRRLGAVLLDAEQAVIFEQAAHGEELAVQYVHPPQVVHFAEDQHAVDFAT